MTELDIQDIWQFLLSRRTIDENGCWIYHGTDKGVHKCLKINGKQYGVHRLAWRIVNGEDPGEFYVCHKCDVPACFNPSHLFLGTHQDNMDDMRRKGRAKGGRGRPQLTRQEQQDIYDKYMAGVGRSVTYKSLAEEYGVALCTIARVMKERVG